jgi:uncharacterized membrane protein
MLRFVSVVTTGVLSFALLLGCGDKQNPAGDYRPWQGSGGTVGADASGPGCSAGVSYAQTIAPMMAASCSISYCHDTATRMAGVALDTYDGVKASAEISNETIQNGSMPVGEGLPLTEADRQSFDAWVKAGTPNN